MKVLLVVFLACLLIAGATSQNTLCQLVLMGECKTKCEQGEQLIDLSLLCSSASLTCCKKKV